MNADKKQGGKMGYQQKRGQTRQCNVDELQPELLKLAKQYFTSNSRVLVCFENKRETYEKGFFGESVQYEEWEAAICTQDRVIWLGRHLSMDNKWKPSATTIELSNIEVVQETLSSAFSLQFYSVEFAGSGNAKAMVYFYSPQAQTTFASTVRDAVARAQGKTSLAVPGSANSVEERIRALKQLRKDGLITEAQFQQKIQEIVNQL
jgi:hypothetical protein